MFVRQLFVACFFGWDEKCVNCDDSSFGLIYSTKGLSCKWDRPGGSFPIAKGHMVVCLRTSCSLQGPFGFPQMLNIPVDCERLGFSRFFATIVNWHEFIDLNNLEEDFYVCDVKRRKLWTLGSDCETTKIRKIGFQVCWEFMRWFKLAD